MEVFFTQIVLLFFSNISDMNLLKNQVAGTRLKLP